MKEVELVLINEGSECTVYSIQFTSQDDSEFQRFYSKFVDGAKLNVDLQKIVGFINRIAEKGAFERMFRYEGKFNSSVVALPTVSSKLRLYCLRLSDSILILGNGGVKDTRTYQEDESLQGYVLTLQRLEEILKNGVQKGTIRISERTIETDNPLEL